MKYTCDCVNSLFFDFNCVLCGCSNSGGIKYLSPFDGSNFNIDKINQIKQEIYTGFENGYASEICKNCYMLHEVEGETKPFTKTLDRIYLSHWYHCNCGCLYCANQTVTHLDITSRSKKSNFYNLLPIIKKLTSEGYIGKNTKIFSIGGEPAVLDEYDKIIEELAKYSEDEFYFLSNGIKFSKTIEKFIKRGNTNLIVSLDCGSKDMFKKLKRVNAFNDVIKNMKKYNSAAKDTNSVVVLKYIIMHKVNDNLDEMKKFIEVAKKIGIKNLYLDVDHNVKQKLMNVPEHWFKLFNYFLSTKDINVNVHDYCQQILDKKLIF